MIEILCDDSTSCKEACDNNEYHRSRQRKTFNMGVKSIRISLDHFIYCIVLYNCNTIFSICGSIFRILKQGYRYHKLRKTFSKFYRRYYDLISKFQVGLKSLLRQGLSEPDFYGDLVYKLKMIVGSDNFSAQFFKIISHYKKIGYNINVLQQTACLVVNPITVGNFAFLFNCTPVGRTSDSMMVPT